MKIVFHADGTAISVYSEKIDLYQLGHLSHHRASHVEPREGGAWIADLSPVGGPCLGPFEKRSLALSAEQAWLDAHLNRLKRIH